MFERVYNDYFFCVKDPLRAALLAMHRHTAANTAPTTMRWGRGQCPQYGRGAGPGPGLGSGEHSLR